MQYNNNYPAYMNQQIAPNAPMVTSQSYGAYNMPTYIPQYNAYMNNPNNVFNQNSNNQNPQNYNMNMQMIDNRIWVKNIDEAIQFPKAPNTIDILWDADGETFYKFEGNKEVEVFKYSKKEPESENNKRDIDEVVGPVSTVDAITLTDIDNLKAQIISSVENSIYKRLDDIASLLSDKIDSYSSTLSSVNDINISETKSTRGKPMSKK